MHTTSIYRIGLNKINYIINVRYSYVFRYMLCFDSETNTYPEINFFWCFRQDKKQKALVTKIQVKFV